MRRSHEVASGVPLLIGNRPNPLDQILTEAERVDGSPERDRISLTSNGSSVPSLAVTITRLPSPLANPSSKNTFCFSSVRNFRKLL